MPDLARIAATSGLAVRKLRYVLDNGILPGGKLASRGRGAPRSFEPFEAFGLVLAATMLEAGLKRALVRDCLAPLSRGAGRDPMTVPLYRAYAAGAPSRLEVGDWRFVRLVAPAARHRTGLSAALDTGWLPFKGPVAAAGYAPLVTVCLDVAQLRAKVDRDR